MHPRSIYAVGIPLDKAITEDRRDEQFVTARLLSGQYSDYIPIPAVHRLNEN